MGRWAALLVGFLFLAACGGAAPVQSGTTITVVAGENFWGSIAAQLGGSKVTVQSVVTDPNADPHEYESSSSDARAFAEARLVILNGAGYDSWGQKLLGANKATNRRVLNIAELLGKKQGDNPHFWYDPSYVTRIADEITSDYESIDPADATYFDQQRFQVKAQFQPYMDEIANIKQKYPHVPIGATESIFQYMAAALGLDLITPILGPNGAGKTTLIRTILGRLAPSAGKLEVFGRTPRRGDPTIGYVPQRPVFDPELSIRGRDFVELGFDGHRWGVRLVGRARAAAAAHASLEAVGAVDYSDRPLGRLSGGEQQRMLLAQALVGSPRLLLMDEPLSYLDVRNQRAMEQPIRHVATRRELTALLIPHDVNPLLPHIDHVLYMAAGKVSMGTPAEIITTERLSEIYSSPLEVVSDSRGRVFVVGLEGAASHAHG